MVEDCEKAPLVAVRRGGAAAEAAQAEAAQAEQPELYGGRASEVLTDRRKTRNSILAESFVSQAPTAKRGLLQRLGDSVVVQIVMFFLAAAYGGLTPAFKRMLQDVAEDGTRSFPFIGQSVYLVDYLHTMLISHILAVAFGGWEGVKGCWDVKSMLIFAPTMVLASTAEAMQMPILLYMDGTAWRIIKQLKLPLIAVGCRFLLGRKGMTYTQWLLLCCVTTSVIGYCIHSSRHATVGSFSMLGLGLACASVGVMVIGQILGDKAYKSTSHPLYTQMAQGRVASFICILITIVGICAYTGDWSRFLFGGWNLRAWALALWLCSKDWIGAFVLKHLDSIWKSLASVVALVIAYAYDTTWGTRQVEGVGLCMMLSVIFTVVCFAVAKREAAVAAADGKKT